MFHTAAVIVCAEAIAEGDGSRGWLMQSVVGTNSCSAWAAPCITPSSSGHGQYGHCTGQGEAHLA